MADAVRRMGGTDVGAAETGIAGPVRARSHKPVGTCYLAIARPDRMVCEEHVFPGDREEIRRAICKRIYDLLLSLLEPATVNNQ